MKRRFMLTAPLALAGCGLGTRPYTERRQWPLLVRRPQSLPPRRGGAVLLVRSFAAGPGMEARGLQSVQPDGSIRTEFYEEWSVPPSQAVEEALRGWLAESGLFSAVVAPGSRLTADLVLEGELDALWTLPAGHAARAALGVTLVAEGTAGTRLVLQRRVEGEAALAGATPQDAVAAITAAVGVLCGRVEAAVGGLG
jgi:cholesterol transport system auxiliary component